MSAIDPPMCRLCKHAHWQRQGCIYYTVVSKGTVKPRPKKRGKRKAK